MSRVYDALFLPGDYHQVNDVPIQNLPLIDTSLNKLAKAGWNLTVEKRYLPTRGHTKLRYRFYNPNKEDTFIVFRFWISGIVANQDLLKIIWSKDLTPNFNRVPSFTLLPSEVRSVEKIEEDELQMLQRFNSERMKTLPRTKKISRKTAKVFDLAEYLRGLDLETEDAVKYA